MATAGAAPAAFPDRSADDGPESMSDAELVQLLVRGSQEAIAFLYDRHASLVFAAALRSSGDHGVAEEVVQDTFLVLWNRAELFDPSVGSLTAWLVTIARNRAIDRLRAAGRRLRASPFSSMIGDREDDGALVAQLEAAGHVLAAAAPDPGPELALTVKETRASLDTAVAVLAAPERQLILLAYRDGLSQSEIAARLGWPLGTVKTRTRRALRHLRDQVDP